MKRPGFVDTTGRVMVLNELDKLTGKIIEFDGIVSGCAILFLTAAHFYRDGSQEDLLGVPISMPNTLRYSGVDLMINTSCKIKSHT